MVNVALTRAVAAHGLHYAPDPSSQAACTIGGNVAENAGGPHCLKYGVTTNHIVALTVLLPDGEVVKLGERDGEHEGYDLVGAFVGSEGCFGIALEITVRLSPNPRSHSHAARRLHVARRRGARRVRRSSPRASVPAALEMIDQATIRAVESSIYAAGYPTDAAAALLIEVDGALAGLEDDVATVEALCKRNGARTVRVARDETERTKLWQGRKKAFGAMGRVSSHLVVQDAVVPRTKLPEVLAQIQEIGERHRVRVCNVFHAGDGNLHPNMPYNAADADETARVHAAMGEIMRACVAAGGTITGEHGVGFDKVRVHGSHLLARLARRRCARCAKCSIRSSARIPARSCPMHSCREWHGTPAVRNAMPNALPNALPNAMPDAERT